MVNPSCTNRPYKDNRDLLEMIDLISRRPPKRVSAFPSVVDLEEICGTGEQPPAFHLWYKLDRLLAFAYLSGDFFALEIDAQAPFETLVEQILSWAQTQIAIRTELPESIFTSCREDDRRLIDLLQKRGFKEDPVRTIHFTRRLIDPIPTPILPEGFTIRPLGGEAEVNAWLTVHYAAHESSQMTAEFRLSMMRTPEYCPELDLVAVAPDGRLAAYVMCHFSTRENQLSKRKVGYTDPVATVPDFQGKGLARALLFAGLNLLQGMGMEVAEVSTSSDNIGMTRTAISAGFRRASTTIFFMKPLEKLPKV